MSEGSPPRGNDSDRKDDRKSSVSRHVCAYPNCESLSVTQIWATLIQNNYCKKPAIILT